MTRSLACLSIVALLSAAAHAQCLGPASGAVQTLTPTTPWYTIDDEGRSIPAIPLGFNFPMAGALQMGPTPGVATHAFVESNGEIYLTNSFYGVVRPINANNFGLSGVWSWRGGAFGSPRIAAWTGDLEAGTGGTWNVYADSTTPNQITFHWNDVYDYGSASPGSYSFALTLYSTGVIDCSYGPLGTFSGTGYFSTGVSVGNDVGTGAEVSQDLSAGADSGSLGMLFEEFFGVPSDLEGRTLRFTPNGFGGYTASLECISAYNQAYGTGCYDIVLATSSFYQDFSDASSASAALTGNAMLLIPVANGYTATWLAGGATAYVPPSGLATSLFPNDDGDDTITPSTPLTLPGGGQSFDLTISHNAIITASFFGNNSWDYTPSGFEMCAYSSELAFYSWSDYRDNNIDPVPSGVIKYEEIGGVLYITWDNVDHWTTPQTTAPSTLQFQLDLAVGTVKYVWVQVDPNTSSSFGSGHTIGYTDAGPSGDPGTVDLATALPIITSPDTVVDALALSASPPPVFTVGGPSVPVTWTVNNVPDAVPPFGIGLGFLMFSGAPIPGGLDLGFLGMPGCNLNIASLDVMIGLPGAVPTDSITLSIPQPLSQGLSFYSQALCLFPPNGLPNGQNAFGGLLSNGVQSYFSLF